MTNTALDRQAAAMERQQSTHYNKGIIAGHHVSKRQASYLKTHTRCTKGHGWTVKGESGSCARCEKEN